MENTIKLLTTIADQLDKQDLATFALRVDAVANKALGIKTAQYVGMQGYAIRNSRCWGNCYRKKRVEFPTKAAQQVWTECHKEYVESINNDGSKWDKYASEQETFVKTASASEKYTEIDKLIVQVIAKKSQSGLDLGNAIFASVEEIANTPQEQTIAASNELLDIASELVSKPEIANKLAEAAQGLLKEAGPMDFFRGLGKGVSNWAGDVSFVGKLSGMRKQIGNSANAFQQSFQKMQSDLTSLKGLLRTTAQTLQGVASAQQSTPKQKQYATSALQYISSAIQSPTGQEFRKALPQLLQSLDGVISGNTGGQVPPAAPQNGQPPAPAVAAPQPPVAPQQPAQPIAPQPPVAPQAQPPAAGGANPAAAQPQTVQPQQQIVKQQMEQIPAELLEHLWNYLQKHASSESYFKLANIGAGGSPNPLATAKPVSRQKQIMEYVNKLDPETIAYLKSLTREDISTWVERLKRAKGI